MDASTAIIGARFAGYLATAILFGTPLFLTYSRGGAVAAAPRAWPWSTVVIAAALALSASLAWTMLETASMSGDAKAATDPGALWSFLSETPFGRAALVRTIAAALAILLLLARPRPGRGVWALLTGLGAITVASLAWSGHGGADEGARGMVHLLADVLHLLAAATWVGALVALLTLVLRSARSGTELAARSAEGALAGFSGVGTALVAVLLLSGLVNSWFLIGPAHLDALITTGYGRLLLAKLILFGAMLCLAAVNRFLLTPRLTGALKLSGPTSKAVSALRAGVLLETTLAVLVLLAVSWLGTLMPPMAAM